MQVDFYDLADPLRHVTRDVPRVPAVGETIAWHKDSGSTRYTVMGVVHTFEDRSYYKERAQTPVNEGYGDRVCVTIEREATRYVPDDF